MSSPSLPPTTVPPPTSTASAPTSTQTSTSSTTDATLYLYTFLATLVLLLAVSSAIVIRSLMLRRRHQRLVDEAIRTGTWMPRRFDSATTRRRRDFGQKPTMWEARVADGDGDGLGECEMAEKSRWMDIRPVYAAYVHPHRSPSPSQAQAQAAPGLVADPEPSISRARFMWPFAPKRSLPSTQPAIVALSSASPSVPPPAPTPTSARTVRVGVLIAMPRSSHAHAPEEAGPPVVEIGISETVLMDDRAKNDG